MNANSNGIAIIGMSGRFPGAENLDAFWQNLIAGVESISFFNDEELTASGFNAAELRQDPNNVAARGIISNAEWFDAAFFNLGAKEAEVTDPQQRLFLEASWQAFENAGYDPARIKGYAGVYAGMSSNSYYAANLQSRPELIRLVGRLAITLGNEKDYLSTRVAYKLNLKGPALTINTACSSSLVAVCQACQALFSYQCDLALAGGVSVSFPQKRAFYYQEGSMISPDGHSRPFDAQAAGTNFGDGLGVVVLKRLAEALNDGDQIHAVIKGFGVNNDGSAKVGFTAPSVNGQAEVIALALAQADFNPGTISYLEAHGTATPLGDPIEVAALTHAFRAGTTAKNFCALGSVKSNIGHLDAAAGIAGLIKTALALKHRMLPPSLHFTRPNPKIDFANSPFNVNSKLTNWEAGSTPRRAGVSAFGFGGTNAHVVLEEAPDRPPSGPSRAWQLLVLSAKTGPALEAASANLRAHLTANPNLNLADVAFTLQVGRQVFPHRRMLVCRDLADAITALAPADAQRVFTQHVEAKPRPLVFMFPGQGAQYVNMGAELYRAEPIFKAAVDQCAEILKPHLGLDLRHTVFPAPADLPAAEELLIQTRITQPAIFVFEYALAKLWESWGIVPGAMTGHSVGEYVAACLAGVFTLEDALKIVALRAQLVQNLPGGAMLAVRLPESEMLPHLTGELSVAAINSPSLCVVSGPSEAVAGLEAGLKAQGVAARRLHTSHAFHSAMMDPVLQPLATIMAGIRLSKPKLPYISNVTGRWITEREATSPEYWAKHVRQTVRFAAGVGELLKSPGVILLEAGPGQTLTPLVNQHPAKGSGHVTLSSFSATKEQEMAAMLSALGKLWLAGFPIDWSAFYAREQRRRVPLPTYPFERRRFWVEPARPAAAPPAAADDPVNSDKMANAEAALDQPANSLPCPTVAASVSGAGDHSLDGREVASRQQQILATLRAQFQELSGTNLTDTDVSVTFMEMGLDSLLLAQASQLIAKRFGIQIAFRQLLEEVPTLDRLAGFLDQKLPPGTAETAAHPVPVQPATTPAPTPAPASLEALEAQLQTLTRQIELLRQAQSGKALAQAAEPSTPVTDAKTQGMLTLPLSEPQLELWLAATSSPEASCAYNQTISIHLRRPLVPAALTAALQELVKRHDALRATFLPDGSGQQIHSTLALDVPLRDFTAMADNEQERTLAEALTIEENTPFDLARGPLIRAQIFKLSETYHVLLVSAHHLVLDGWSMGVVLRELSELYPALAQGISPRLKPAMQYREYLQWLATPEIRERAAAAEAYWVSQFTTLPEPIDLPADRPHLPSKTCRAASRSFRLDPVLYSALKETAAAQGCTLFTYLLSSLNIWLYRLTGRGDLVVGFAAAGQLAIGNGEHQDNRSLVGHCVNVLPLRSNCDGETVIADFIKQVGSLVLNAYDHQAYTFGSLVKKLNLPRQGSRPPLIHLVFNLSRASRNLQLPGAEAVLPPKSFNFFDLSFMMHDTKEDLRIECLFNCDSFKESTVERWLGHWKSLLEQMIAHPNRHISSLSLLTEAERQQLQAAGNQGQPAFPTDKCVHELFAEQARRTPEAAALCYAGQQLTYEELDARANQLAHYLQELGVGPNSLVGICVERSLEMVVGLLGILKAGGAYVPLDPEYPKERLAFMLRDAGTTLLLTKAHLEGSLPTSQARIVRLDADWPTIAQKSRTPVQNTAMAQDLAYMIYTSGSTGSPKGVLVEHAALVQHCLECRDFFELTSKDRVLQFLPLSFDPSIEEILPPLLSGALVVLRESMFWAPNEFPRKLAESGLTVVYLPTAYWNQLAPTWVNSTEAISPQKLRLLVVGGDVMSPKVLQQWQQTAFNSVRLVNAYGPTETVVTAASFEIPGKGGEPAQLERVPIGRPRGSRQILVLDRWGQPLPAGVAGELYIGGTTLARGYHNQPELTAEKFITNPFARSTGSRLYRTGDMARYLADGNLEFLGRIDQQVKIRGFRIELGEIETQLNQHPAVQAAAVVVREDVPGDKRLVAYIVGQRNCPPPSELRDFLQAKLPEYMIPAAFVTIATLPLTPNGKVDRKALPPPTDRDQCLGTPYLLPQNEMERTIASIWQKVLRLDRVGIEDSFFGLGGHSLLLVQVQSELAKTLSEPIIMMDLFRYPTISSLARHLSKMGKTETHPVETGKQAQQTQAGRSRLNRRLKLSQGLQNGQAATSSSEVTHE